MSGTRPDAGGSERSLLRDREPVVLLDRKGRSYLRTLKQGGRMSVHGAPVACDEVIGRPEGSTLASASGERLLVLRPTYAQLIPSLPRQAQPIYPKDVGPLLLWGDIAPGHLVVEVGTGPAALTLALLRAVGPTGRLVSYELREDFATIARDNVARFHGPSPNWVLRVADAFDGILERDVDRMVIDLAEPWRLLDRAADTLRPGAVLTAFVPTALQVKSHVDALVADARFGAVEAFETLLRFWHVGPRSLRPEHRMVAHTGFLIVARRLAGSAQPTGSRSELTPSGPYSTEESDGYSRIAGSTHDDESGGIRQRIWKTIEREAVGRFPFGSGRIPNFVGAEQAAQLLREMAVWRRSLVVKVNPDAPQLAVRRLALQEGKIVYMAVPRLRTEKCFIEIDPQRFGNRASLAASIAGACKYGRAVAPREMRPVDLIVCGSVGVGRDGARLGKGGGYCDLEYGLLREEGKVRESTPILTTVHPLQVTTERIPMLPHDLPVDFLVTPSEVIATRPAHPRPRGIYWDLLRTLKINAIPLLRKRLKRGVTGAPSPRRL